jgi:uncharacterized membrane protein YfcA
MDIGRDAFLLGAAALAGGVNAVAGGGTLLSFPAAMAWGLPSTIANATNAVALVPGSIASAWAYRRELGAVRQVLALLALPAAVGGVIGAIILQHTPVRRFDAIVPWLVLGATCAILFQRKGAKPAAAGAPGSPRPWRRRTAAAIVLQLSLGVYGGFFGAAMGIVMLAFLPLVIGDGIQQRNAVKNLLAVLINGVASIYFVAVGLVSGRAALLMAAGAVAGGFVGGHLARRAPAAVVRGLVAIGLGLSALLAYRAYARV